jgi:hypothetical protein
MLGDPKENRGVFERLLVNYLWAAGWIRCLGAGWRRRSSV